jgi:hypothetical protein
MNQLLNVSDGFDLGHTTDPKTRGIWMWYPPPVVHPPQPSYLMRQTNGSRDDVALIFLDTEGLFAANVLLLVSFFSRVGIETATDLNLHGSLLIFSVQVSEAYDAKIYAIATLLANEVLFNSVRFIGMQDIEYLELLARR